MLPDFTLREKTLGQALLKAYDILLTLAGKNAPSDQ